MNRSAIAKLIDRASNCVSDLMLRATGSDSNGGNIENSVLPARNPIHAFELEPRVLYSASPMPLEQLAEAQSDPDSNLDTDAQIDQFAADQQADIATIHDDELLFTTPLEDMFSLDDFVESGADSNHPESNTTDSLSELVFIDEAVADLDRVIADLQVNQPDAEIVILRSDRNGLLQISEALAGRSGVDAMHIISHGADGSVLLGNSWLTSDSLHGLAGNGLAGNEAAGNEAAGDVAGWRVSLSADADILFYGCDLASNDAGLELIESLTALTGADIAASEDVTGHASPGDDWDLEYHSGAIESNVVISASLQEDWQHKLAAYTVTSTADDGSVGTLRWAIDQSNASTGVNDTINFNIANTDSGHVYYQDDGIAGSLSNIATTTLDDASITDFDPDYAYGQHSWFRIDLNDALPELSVTDSVFIDGYSQSGASENTLAIGHNANLRIELTNSAADSNSGLTFHTGANGSTLQGLAINDFGALGVLVNYDVHGVTIRGNYIGTDITGTLDHGNGDAGLQLRSSNNVVGGIDAGARNVISGSNQRGIAFYTTGTITGNVVENNYIGVDATGNSGLGNNSHGIQLFDTDGARVINNVISGNQFDGIRGLTGSEVHNSVIQGNMIGVGADGTTVIGNGGTGLRFDANDATGNLIGGTGIGQGNVISGNAFHGISFDGAVSSSSIVGNFIGTDQTSTLDLGNGSAGIYLLKSATSNQIGGTLAGQANVIAYNGEDGVSLATAGIGSGYSNTIRGNRIFANDDLAIDLSNDGISLNDYSVNPNISDVDDGPNRVQNFPDITSILYSGGDLTIAGEATGRDQIDYVIDVYVSTSVDAMGSGQADRYLGAFTANTTDDYGNNGFFNHTFSGVTINPGEHITATATHPDGSTSELSFALPVVDSTYSLLLSTKDKETSAGTPGITDWDKDEILEFDDSGTPLKLGQDTTGGEFFSLIDLSNFESSGDDVKLTALHHVRSDLTVGTGANTFDLQQGDLLIAFDDGNKTFDGNTTSVTVDNDDVIVFRADTSGDYSSGEFYHLLEDPMGGKIRSLTLVESAGGVTFADGAIIQQGTFLFSSDSGSDRDVHTYLASSVGPGSTAASSTQLLLDGENGSNFLDFGSKIEGISIVESNTIMGGIGLRTGDLLISLDSDDSEVGTDDIDTEEQDVFVVRLTQTSLTGFTSGNAKLLFDGDDVGLDAGAENIHAFTYKANNQLPTDIAIDNDTVDEFTDTTGGYSVGTLSATDADAGDSHTFAILPGGDQASFTITGGDQLVLADGVLDRESQSSYSVNLEVTDSAGATYTETLVIAVNDLNDNPIITSNGGGTTATVSVPENTTAVTTITATDEDIPADSLSYNITGGADSALFAINATGDLSFVTAPDFESPGDVGADNDYEVEVTVDDGNGGFDIQTVTVTVTNDNESPTAIAPANPTVDEHTDTTGGYSIATLTTSDEDAGETFSYSIATGGDETVFTIGGTNSDELILTDGVLDHETKSSYAVFVEVTDSDSNTYTEEITVGVNDINDDPSSTAISNTSVNEDDATFSYDVSGSFADVDAADTLTYTAELAGGSPLPGWLNFNSTNGTFSGTPTNADVGSLTIEVTADDGHGGTLPTESFVLTINNTNDTPTAIAPTALNVNENIDTSSGRSLGTLTTSDIDLGETFSYSIVGGADAASFSIGGVGSDELILTDGTLDFETQSSYSVTVRVTDSGGLTHDETLTVNVNDLNETPTDIAPNSIAVDENIDTSSGTSVGTLTATDQDGGEAFTYSIVGGADAASFSIGGVGSDELILTDGTLDFETQSSYSVTVRVTDSGGLTQDETLTVNINDLNDAPIITSDGGGNIASINVQENTTAVTTVTATDADLPANSLTYSISGGVDAAQFTISAAGDLTFIGAPDFEAPVDSDTDNNYEVDVTVSDGNGGFDTQSITVSIVDGNEAPTTSGIANVTVDEDSARLFYDLHSAFADGEDPDSALTYTIESVTNPALFTSTSITATDNIQLEFAPDAFGTSFITVQAEDTGGLSVQTTFGIDVNPVNDDPFVENAATPVIVDEDAAPTTIDLSTIFNDVDIATGDALTYSLVSNGNSTLTAANVSGNQLTLNYLADQFGTATIIVSATDSFNQTVTETINVTVNSINDAPTVDNHSYAVDAVDSSVAGNVLNGSLDIDNNPLSVSLLAGPSNGVLTLNTDGTFVFVPEAGFSGVVSFDFVATDGADSSNIGTATITIAAAPPAETVVESVEPESETEDEEEELQIAPPPVETDGSDAFDIPKQVAEVVSSITPISDAIGPDTEVVQDLVATYALPSSQIVYHRIVNELDRSIETLEFVRREVEESTPLMLTSLNVFSDDIDEATAELDYAFVNSVVAMSGVSIGVVTWVLRSGVFLASMMSNLPAWRIFDPTAVLGFDEEDDESLQDIVDAGDAEGTHDSEEQFGDTTEPAEVTG